jgi:hypothetical protein
MARISTKNPILAPPQVPDPIQLLSEVRVDGGMNTRIDAADIPQNQLVLARNVYVDADKLIRFDGTILLTPPRPTTALLDLEDGDQILQEDTFDILLDQGDTDPINVLYTFQRFNGTTVFLRFTDTKVWRRLSGSWLEVTSATPYTLPTGGRVRLLPFNDRLFFVSGTNNIYEIDFTTNTYAYLGNAGKYKYITGFFNRIVGANKYDLSTPNPTLVAWSGDLNFAQWDPNIDISAGNTPLLEAASDFADPISGLFGFASVMLILRERSLWTAQKRPVASNPFLFQAAFPFVGCDTPNSAVQKRNGIIWYDYRSNQVYDYTLGDRPREVGEAVRDNIKPKITNKENPIGSYNPITNEYILTIPGTNTTVTYAYVLNLNNGAWTERTIENCSCIYAFDNTSAALLIDELSGTINELSGTINDLANLTTNPPTLYYGMSQGDILIASTVDTDNGAPIETILQSKIFKLYDRYISITRIRFTYIPLRAGEFTIQYNNGNGWVTYKTVTFGLTAVGVRSRVACTKQVRAREFQWRITSLAGNFATLDYSIDITPASFGKI